ncbi:PREDICTED: uncharacterized protein K02A2.6-like [Cyphomyrmex costatus]|uniref:uncharacterized protein K02A2.6-like n=1 Tax=Cyphomyrmex costatus TaxID=456900 RepID=UPI00085241C1|nr:PREDICTED: uncharacterized protein K02A2.6-like [Cyphomyrmex costatus]
MDRVTAGLDFCFTYIDDILIASQDEIQHKKHFEILFNRLQQYSVAINSNKCVFDQKKVNFLGHTITVTGIKPVPEKVRAITEFPEPATVKEFRRHKRGTAKIKWTPELRQSFQQVKEHLAQVTSLTFPDSNATFSLQTDASDKAIGAALQQRHSDGILEVQINSRQDKSANYFSSWNSQLTFVTSQVLRTSVADALSCADTIVMPTSLDMQEIAVAQVSDEELQQLKQSTSTFLKLKKFTLSETASIIYCDTSEEEVRPYIPGPLRRRVFDLVNQMSHPSGRATHRQIVQKFVWPSMAKDIKKWARTCLACQQSKIHRNTHTSPINIPIPVSNTSISILSAPYLHLKEVTAKMFFTHWIARFGASRLITSDQGSQFEAQLFDVLTKLVSSKRCRTIAYHLEANGIIERWHRSLKIALMFHGEAQWTDALPVHTAWSENLL